VAQAADVGDWVSKLSGTLEAFASNFNSTLHITLLGAELKHEADPMLF
jgi:hypothetical protein